MKYFTPDLLESLNQQVSQSQWSVATSAMEEWDKKAAEYDKRLKAIRPKVDRSILECIESLSWHDAQVLNLSYQDDDKLALLLVQNDQLHVLTCTLVRPPTLIWPATPPSYASVGLFWLYEEIDVDRGGTVLRVLLSDGTELELPVSRITLQSFDVRPRNGQKYLRPVKGKKLKSLSKSAQYAQEMAGSGRRVSAAEFALYELSPLIPPHDRLSREVRFPIEFRERKAASPPATRRARAL